MSIFDIAVVDVSISMSRIVTAIGSWNAVKGTALGTDLEYKRRFE